MTTQPSKSKWVRFDLYPKDRKNPLPSRPCVYAVYFDDQLVYVGQTNRLSNRFSEHKFRYGYARDIITPWVDLADSTRFHLKVKFSEKYGDWAMWEIRLIRRLQPIYNRHHKTRRS